jgi:hypothetical protein
VNEWNNGEYRMADHKERKEKRNREGGGSNEISE